MRLKQLVVTLILFLSVDTKAHLFMTGLITAGTVGIIGWWVGYDKIMKHRQRVGVVNDHCEGGLRGYIEGTGEKNYHYSLYKVGKDQKTCNEPIDMDEAGKCIDKAVEYVRKLTDDKAKAICYECDYFEKNGRYLTQVVLDVKVREFDKGVDIHSVDDLTCRKFYIEPT